jgi:curved DNA-binding protein CbpA
VPAPLDRREALARLRLPPSADREQVKRAYRRLALDHHPDAGGDAAGFHKLQRAY